MFMFILGTAAEQAQETANVQVTLAWIGVVGVTISGFFAWLSARRSKEARNGNTMEHFEVVAKLDGLRESVHDNNKRNGEHFSAIDQRLTEINDKFGRHLEWHLDRKDPDRER